VVHEFAQEHPIHLPVFPELGDTPPPPPSPSVDHMTTLSASAVDHTTALGLGEGDVDMGMGTDSSPIVRLNTFTDTRQHNLAHVSLVRTQLLTLAKQNGRTLVKQSWTQSRMDTSPHAVIFLLFVSAPHCLISSFVYLL